MAQRKKSTTTTKKTTEAKQPEVKETQDPVQTTDTTEADTATAPEVSETQTQDANDAVESTDTTVDPAPEKKEPEPAPSTPEPQEANDEGEKDIDGPLSLIRLNDVIETYLTHMSPGVAVIEKEGARQQTQLATALFNNVYGAKPEEFAGNMKFLLETVNKHRKGAFHERYVYRFTGNMTIPSERRALFEDLLTLTLTTADVGAKNVGKQIDIKKLIDQLADERMIQNLQSYYNVG